MKRRLRKKLYLGEFQELGFEVEIRFDPATSIVESNSLMDRWIEEAVEGNNLICGGGGKTGEWSFFVSPTSEITQAEELRFQRSQVEKWLQATCENYSIGPVFADLSRAYSSSPKAANKQKRINRQRGLDSQIHCD